MSKIFSKHDFGNPILKKIANWVCVIATIAPIGYVVTMWGQIPTQIPSHFNAAGVADSYSGKESLVFLLFMTIFMYATMSFASAFPQCWNIGGITSTRRPKSMKAYEYSDEEIERAYHLTANMLCWMQMTVVIMFSYMTIQSARCENLGVWFLAVTLGALFGSMIYYMFKIYKKNPHKVADE